MIEILFAAFLLTATVSMAMISVLIWKLVREFTK